MVNKTISILFVFIGIILIIIDLMRENRVCPKEKIVYKYIPKTFEEEQQEPVYVSDIFKTMFSLPSPWIVSINENKKAKEENINNFFVSQM
jgi:hypothetical protein